MNDSLHENLIISYANVGGASVIIVGGFEYFAQRCVPFKAKTTLEIKSMTHSRKVIEQITIPFI